MAARCAAYWLPIMKKYSIIPTWSGNYQGSKTGVGEDPTSDSDSDTDDELERADDKSDCGEVDVDDILDF